MGCGSSKEKVHTNRSQIQPKRHAKSVDPFKEFPAPHILKLANVQYTAQGNPIPLTEEGEIDAYPCPSPKNDVYKEEDYAYLEDYCLQTPAHLSRDPLQHLVDYLIRDPRTSTDVGKARAIYRWITAQPVSRLPKDISNSSADSAYSYIADNEGKRDWDYSELFVDMCRCAGLKSEVINGIVKGVNFQIGDTFDKDDANGDWAAVLIDSTWRLVDVHWGATYINDPNTGEWVLIDDQGVDDDSGSVSGEDVTHHYHCNNFYFLTNPEEFIYNHMPDNSKWQLLARPVTSKEFEQMAALSQHFFDSGIILDSFRKCIQYSKDGEIALTLTLPRTHEISFSYNFWISKKGLEQGIGEKDDKLSGIKLSRYVFLQRLGQQEVASINFPVTGKFKLDLYGRRYDTSTIEDNEGLPHLCAYVIHCDSPKADCMALPVNSRVHWGPNFDTEQAGLKAITHPSGEVKAERGVAHIEFEAEHDVEILAKLYATSKEEELNNYLIHYRQRKRVKLRAKAPEIGRYGLSIYAKRQGEEKNYDEVCTYLLKAEEPPEDPTPFPEVTNGVVGPVTDSQLKLISPGCAMVETKETEMMFVFKVLAPLDMMCCLKQGNRDGTTEERSDLVLGVKESDQYTCFIRFREAGLYVLEICTRPSDSADDTSYSVEYNCLIKAQKGNHKALPFPGTFSTWKEGKLIEPLTGVLPSNQTIRFALTAPFAYDVIAVIDEDWSQLTRHEGGLWEGDVETGPAGSIVKISGKTETEAEEYWGLVDFKVGDGVTLPLSAEQMDVVRKQKDEEEAEKMREQDAAYDAEKRKRKREAEEAKLEEEIIKKKDADDEEKRRKQQQEADGKRKDKAAKFVAALRKATSARDQTAIQVAMTNVKKNKFEREAAKEMIEARKVLESLARVERLQHAVLSMDQATMSEMRSYINPPAGVHEIMTAAFLLLGDDEEKTQKWTDCQSFITNITTGGKVALQRRVKSFTVDKTHPEIAARVMQILQDWRIDDVRDISGGTAVFYDWAGGMVEELYRLNPHAKNASPADLQRQRELLMKR